MALKHIGLGLVKMQYFENSLKVNTKEIVVDKENSISQNGIDLWKTAWTDDNTNGCSYLFKHMLENRHGKSYRCILFRSRFCRNQAKMTRLNWIHHLRQGHVKIRGQWKKILKKSSNFNIDKVFEIYCSLCNKTKRMTPFYPAEFMQHMKKFHPQFFAVNDYSTYFKRCFICNDQTKSFEKNLDHRRLCLAALVKDPNQAGTEHFNNCFKIQRLMTTLSLMSSINDKNSFEVKLKLFNSFKSSSLYFWLHFKNTRICSRPVSKECEPKRLKNESINNITFMNDSPLSIKSSKNEINQTSISSNSSFEMLRQSILKSKTLTHDTVTMSERIAPGKDMLYTKLKKLFIPIPFLIKDEIESKETFIKWRKSVKEEHSTIQSIVPWYCEICNAMLKNVKSAYCHMKMCHNSGNFNEASCKSCNRRFLTSQGYKNHFNGMKKCPVARRCVVCNISLSISDIYEHVFMKHKEDFDAIINNQSCLICRADVDDMETHLFDFHGMSNVIKAQPEVGKCNFRNGSFHSCSTCSLTYFSEVELRNHRILSDHYLECSKCPTLKFYLSWELMQHLFLAHKGDEGVCQSICDLCNGDANLRDIFYAPSAKVKHFIKYHLQPCIVLLKDVSKVAEDHH